MKLGAFVLVAATLSGCAAGLPNPTSDHLLAVREREPDVTLADLSRGRSLYVAKCAGCHALKDPASLPPDAWVEEVREMRAEQGVILETDDERDIVRYLEAASLVARR